MNQFLRLAVMAGVESAVQVHIERGDDLNARDNSGLTPLMLSAVRNKAGICKLLLSAGADHGLLDPSGKTALQIATAAGAGDTAAILNAVCVSLPSLPPSELELEVQPEPASDAVSPIHHIVPAATPIEPAADSVPITAGTFVKAHTLETGLPVAPVLDELGDGEFDLSGWEAEEEPLRPEADLVVVESASSVQIAITAHEPIDSSAEWDDIEAFLPAAALPLARSDDVEGRARLRLLLLRALREGSVPALDVQAQTTNEDRSANPEAEAFLAMVINDLGAETDERFEVTGANESFEVSVDPKETPDEEAAVDEALVAIDRAASPRNEPLRIYQREFQRLRLLTAEEEIRLAKEMEVALDAALDALAAWPDGIARTLTAGAQAVAGSRQISSIRIGSEPDPEPASAESLEMHAPAQDEHDEAWEEDAHPAAERTACDGEAHFAEALRKLAGLVDRANGRTASFHEIRQALAGLRLDRRFLLELIDPANGPTPSPSFQSAMADFLKARDRMATANLKLSFFHARKYLHSGELLDDLAQEGNVGLLKAVDKYDWRRGYRFSTYATWWIRQQISRYIADKVRTIRVPVHIHEKLQRVERMARAFEQAAGREPTADELAERVEMPRHKLDVLLRIAPEPSAIDEATVDELIAIDAREAYSPPDPADVVDQIQLSQAVDRYISSLSTKDRKAERILRMRFGIGISEALTLDEIGKRFNVTRERIRQIEAKALRTLKYPGRSVPFERMALGSPPGESLFATRAHDPEFGDETDATNSASRPATQKRPSALQQPSESTEPAGSSYPPAFDCLLAQAIELGIPVDDDRETSGNIWVELPEPLDNTHRQLVQKLLESGFAFWPGKGYWI